MEKKREKTKQGWFKKRDFNAVLKVENTPSRGLADRIKRRIRQDPDLNCMKLLVTEKNGTKIGSVANYTDPYKKEFCMFLM